MTKITEQTEVKLDLKGIIKIVVLTATFVGMYYTLQSDIEEAKKMPPAVIDRIEYDLKQQWQTQHIEKLEEKVDEILFWCREVDKEVYKNKKK
tara:strand:+ start:281 stop:559 length:279 start_codon:yes stop_codon:yes gene_type:complete